MLLDVMSTKDIPKPVLYQNRLPKWQTSSLCIIHCSWFKKVLKVSIIKICSLFVSLSVPQFHRETTLRTPRELPEIAKSEKVLFVKISQPLHFTLYPCLYTLHSPPYTRYFYSLVFNITLYPLRHSYFRARVAIFVSE